MIFFGKLKKAVIRGAMMHPDVPGAGKQNRIALGLSPQDVFDTIMAEFAEGILRNDNGNVIVSQSAALQLAYGEMAEMRKSASHKYIKREGIKGKYKYTYKENQQMKNISTIKNNSVYKKHHQEAFKEVRQRILEKQIKDYETTTGKKVTREEKNPSIDIKAQEMQRQFKQTGELPDHLKKIVIENSKITDVTPAGYGPDESNETDIGRGLPKVNYYIPNSGKGYYDASYNHRSFVGNSEVEVLRNISIAKLKKEAEDKNLAIAKEKYIIMNIEELKKMTDSGLKAYMKVKFNITSFSGIKNSKNREAANSVALQMGILHQLGFINRKALKITIKDKDLGSKNLRGQYYSNNHTIFLSSEFEDSFIHEYFHHQFETKGLYKTKAVIKLIEETKKLTIYKSWEIFDKSKNMKYYTNDTEMIARIAEAVVPTIPTDVKTQAMLEPYHPKILPDEDEIKYLKPLFIKAFRKGKQILKSMIVFPGGRREGKKICLQE